MSKSQQIATAEEARTVPVTDVQHAKTIMDTLQSAVSQGASPETLEKLLDMSERVQANQARQDFFAAFHEARRAMPVIRMRGYNDTTRSSYAKLDDVQRVIVPIYTEHGFSMIFSSGKSELEGHRKIRCKLAHVSGHVEEYDTDLPLDMHGMKGSQNKTAIHGAGSADTYGQRYLTKMVWNLEVSNEVHDDDGQSAGEIVATEEQIEELRELMKESGADLDVFLEYFQVNKIEDMPASKVDKARAMLNRKKQRAKKS